jgi:predicted secreted protein
MATTTAVAIYFLIWWIVLFAVLPWGVRAQGEEGAPGTDPGAPRVPRLIAKLVWTTVVAGVLWGICAVVYVNGLVTLDGLAALLGFPAQKP